MTDTARVAARRVLVRHLSEQIVVRLPFADRLFAILDDLEAVGALRGDHPAPRTVPASIPRQRDRPPTAAALTTGERVRSARAVRGWTLARLAGEASVSVPTVCRIQRGDHVGAASLRAVLGALELTEPPTVTTSERTTP